MAKILFISINDVNAEGLRVLSSVLKRDGHETHMVFLKRYGPFFYPKGQKAEAFDWAGVDPDGRDFRYGRGPHITDAEKKILLTLIDDLRPQIIGFSVTTPLRPRAAAISRLIKENFTIPVLWGGPDPTVRVKDCLSVCDLVCVGEGEKAMADIAAAIDDKRDIRGVNNLAYMTPDGCVRNPLNPLAGDLDALPLKDIDPKNKYLIENDSLTENFCEVSYTRNQRYHLISSRGCPYRCSYCCEDFYKKLYAGQVFLRRRSVDSVIRELKGAKSIGCQIVQFEDEVFSFDVRWLTEFRDRYKNEIALPFECYIFPGKDNEKVLPLLKDAGLVKTCLALQSGSERINRDVFHRRFDRGLFIKTADQLTALGIAFYVDVITFNPFETEDDLRDTLAVLNDLRKPFWLCVNKLYAVEGTRIWSLLAQHRDRAEHSPPQRLFYYYSRLFWLAAVHGKALVNGVRISRIFKYVPFLFRVVRWLGRSPKADYVPKVSGPAPVFSRGMTTNVLP